MLISRSGQPWAERGTHKRLKATLCCIVATKKSIWPPAVPVEGWARGSMLYESPAATWQPSPREVQHHVQRLRRNIKRRVAFQIRFNIFYWVMAALTTSFHC